MNPAIVGIYGQVLGDLCAGEIKQMKLAFQTTVDWDTYIQKSINKTASLSSAGTHAGAILNRQPDEVVKELKLFGSKTGNLFSDC